MNFHNMEIIQLLEELYFSMVNENCLKIAKYRNRYDSTVKNRGLNLLTGNSHNFYKNFHDSG